MTGPVTLTLDREDVRQIVDGLAERAEQYELTARHWQGEYIEDGCILEAENAEEATAIASHYRDIIAKIEGAL